jgi:hypothetical protein
MLQTKHLKRSWHSPLSKTYHHEAPTASSRKKAIKNFAIFPPAYSF